MQIDVSLPHWKQLALLLRDDDDTFDAVIGRLLSPNGHAPDDSDSLVESGRETGGAFYKGVFLPNGTDLRAKYKGRMHYATIADGQWVDMTTGEVRSSPSQAAYSITGGNVNGWLFWLVKRPEDGAWQTLNRLRAGNS